MKTKLTYILLCYSFCSTLFAQNACDEALSQQTFFSEKEVLKHVQTLSSDVFQGRRTGTNGAQKAMKYIVNQFHFFGVKPLVKDYLQPFNFTRRRHFYEANNVLGVIKGSKFPDKYIVITAHYDHEGVKNKEIFNGADDNASGVGGLIAFAEYFKSNPPEHSVILAAFDGEELGLQGSKYYVNNTVIPQKQIVLNLNMDMISRSEKSELFAVGARLHEPLKTVVDTFEECTKVKLLLGHDGFDKLENWIYASDHANFHKKDIPFIYFGVADHEDYHEPTDDFENIQPEFYTNAIKTIISVFRKIDKQSL